MLESAQEIPLVSSGFEIEELSHADDAPPPAAPTVRLVDTHVVLDSGTADATVGAEHATPEDHEFDMDAGDIARMSGATVRIVVRACATVETESVFGNRSHTRECVTVRVPHTEMQAMAGAL